MTSTKTWGEFFDPHCGGGGKWRPFRFRPPSWMTSFREKVIQDGGRKRKGRHFPPPPQWGSKNSPFTTYLPSHVHVYMQNCTYICIYARLYLHREYTDKILLHHYHHCIYCTMVHFMFACLPLFFFSFLFLFSLFMYYYYFLYHPKDSSELLCMLFFHRHSPLIVCKIVIRNVFSFSLEPN